jgi:hypothetical protein
VVPDLRVWRAKKKGSEMTRYILDSEDWPVPSANGLQWAEWHVANQGRCEIGRKAGTGFLVVTRFVGLDYNFTGKGEPLLYRTSLWMDGKYRQRLYATRNEAFKGHYLAVEEARRVTGHEKKKLTAFNTNIRSASITIRMLTLEARKVTVSVFR